MSLTWPWALTALLAFPLLLAYRWWTRRRRRRETVRVPSVALIRAALPGRSLWRRRIPIWLFAAGLVALGTGAARPQASVPVPLNGTSILLALDVSGSMCATDVPPNRLTAAQEAAREFIEGQDDGTRIGLVTFSGIAGLLVEPTTDKKPLLEAIDTLRVGRGTAIGQAILTSVDAIAETNHDVPPTGVAVPPAEPTGDFEPDTIVVLTDGRNTQGVDPLTAATEAASRRVRVYTIGFGTTEPGTSACTADQISGDTAFRGDPQGPPGSGFGRGGRFRQVDEETLTQVADMTGGEYFQAEDAEQLSDVLSDLPGSIVTQRQDVEVTVWFALAGAALLLTALALSAWWTRPVLPAPPAAPPPAAPPPAAPLGGAPPPSADQGRTHVV
ncbi:VWA domain-containing protein [Micromonospora sp. CPCC 205371]|nr:VWA domain-containing protein [Micromonospora sp. CPCC 205371]